MENNFILSSVPLAELLQQFRAIIKEEIKAEQQMQAEEKLLSVAEACKLFKPAISRQTLTNWTKEGLIPMSKYNGKNFYKLSDILEAGTTLKRYKK
jgi:hypothetical protein